MLRRMLPAFILPALIAVPALVFAQEKKKDHPAAPPATKPAEPKPAAPATAPAAKPAVPPTAAGGDKPAAPQAGHAADMEAAMKAMMPGPQHQKLAKLAGDWTVKSKLSMPGGPPAEETEGTAKISTAMEGRFIHEDASGTMMGMPYKSAKLLGFNNGSKKYEAVWVYSMGTGMMTMVGTSSDEGKTIKMAASFDNEVGIKETMNCTYTFADDDHFTVVLDGGKMPDGSPGPTMQSSYTRKK